MRCGIGVCSLAFLTSLSLAEASPLTFLGGTRRLTAIAAVPGSPGLGQADVAQAPDLGPWGDEVAADFAYAQGSGSGFASQTSTLDPAVGFRTAGLLSATGSGTVQGVGEAQHIISFTLSRPSRYISRLLGEAPVLGYSLTRQGTAEVYDLNSSGTMPVGAYGLSLTLRVVGAPGTVSGAYDYLLGVTSLAGDADFDCEVGVGDYVLWAAQFGQTAGPLSADFDGNGEVGAGDYALWAANFGETCDDATASVPEPPGWLLITWTSAGFLIGRGRGPRVRRDP